MSYDWKNVDIEFVEGKYEFAVRNKGMNGSDATVFSFRSPYRYNAKLKITETISIDHIKFNGYGAGDTSSIDSKMEENCQRLFAFYSRYMEREDVKPSEAKAKIVGDLNRSIKECLEMEVSRLGRIESGEGTLYFRKKDQAREFEFDVLSSGEKAVVDLLLDLYLRKDDYNDTVFLIDEPELHINASVQRKLLVEINRLVGDNCQIWIATHSIGFLRALQTEMQGQCQIIKFDPDLNLASECCVLRPSKVGAGLWRELFAIALDDLASLVSPRTLIYCEGRAEPGKFGRERGLDAQVFNNIFSSKYPDTLFISSGGNTELDQRSSVAISILGKVFPKVEILVLKDRDMGSGKEMSESDRQRYLNTNPKNHRVIKRWEIENYLYDKEVLKSYCSGENLIFNEVAYDEFVSDIVNQNLKDETNRVKNFCNIKNNVNPNVFKVKLSDYIDEDMVVFAELENCIFNRA